MKLLKTEFVKNSDKSGKNNFVQICKDGNVACYRRSTLNGSFRGFEVFTFKVIKAGAPMKGGGAELEDREPYPGHSSFGRSAWYYGGEENNALKSAMVKFDAILKGKVEIEISEEDTDTEEETTVPVARVCKGEVTLKLPDGEFSQRELASFNGFDNYKVVYSDLQKMLARGILKRGDKRASTHGKSAQLFVRV